METPMNNNDLDQHLTELLQYHFDRLWKRLDRLEAALDAKAEKPEGEEPEWSWVVPPLGMMDCPRVPPPRGWAVLLNPEFVTWALGHPDGSRTSLFPGDRLVVRDGRVVVERKGE